MISRWRISYGEGWHNNHHAHPAVAPAGHKWWEVDITWWSIRLLRAAGLAYDVKDRIPKGRSADDHEVPTEHGEAGYCEISSPMAEAAA